MKYTCVTIIALVTCLLLNAQTKKTFTRTVFNKEISFIQVDTSYGSQTTVVEYPKFLVLIELPMVDFGADRSSNLVEDIPKAEQLLEFLKKEYNNKPIKYVLSSHWHLHSLSGITPFFKQGAMLVAAKTNWEYSVNNGLFNRADINKLEKQVIQITKDMTLLENTTFPISVLFLDDTYTNKPTKDYLFFYMPKSKCIHASCMCALPEIDFKQRPEFFYNDRITDLEKAISVRKLEVNNLIKLTAEFDNEKKSYKMPALNNSYYSEFKQRGKPMATIVNELAYYELSLLQTKKDSILNYFITKKIAPTIINSTVYKCIKNKNFLHAVEWAQILNTYQIGNADYLDTMGEAYYNAGNTTMAQRISDQLKLLNPKFVNQYKEWEQTKRNSN